MTRVYEWATAVVAAALCTAFWLVAVAMRGFSVFAHPADLLNAWLLGSMPGVFAAWLLIRARPAGDGPEQLVGVAAALMPAHREDWGAAMRAELAHVPGAGDRWSFAAGCVRAALAPRTGWAPVAAASMAGLAAALVLPALTLFAFTFVGLLVLSAPVPEWRRQTVAGMAGVAGVAAAVITVSYLVVGYPSMDSAMRPGHAILLAVVLAAGARLTLTPPRVLLGDPTAQAAAVVAATVFVAGFVLAARAPGADVGGMVSYLIFPPVALFFVGGAVAAGGRSFRAGVLTTVWTVLLSTVWVFVLWIVESARWDHDRHGVLVDTTVTHPFGANLADGIVWVLTWLPAWGLPLGVLGASAGAWVRRRTPVTQP